MEIPVNHQVTLNAIGNNKPVGGTRAITKLYETCRAVLKGERIANGNISPSLVQTTINGDAVKVATVTDMKSGVYIQLAMTKEDEFSIMMTSGQKYSIEGRDNTTCQVSTKIF